MHCWNRCVSAVSPAQQMKFNFLLEFSLGFLDPRSAAGDRRWSLLCVEVISPLWQCLPNSRLQRALPVLLALLGSHFENNIWLPFDFVKPMFNLALSNLYLTSVLLVFISGKTTLKGHSPIRLPYNFIKWVLFIYYVLVKFFSYAVRHSLTHAIEWNILFGKASQNWLTRAALLPHVLTWGLCGRLTTAGNELLPLALGDGVQFHCPWLGVGFSNLTDRMRQKRLSETSDAGWDILHHSVSPDFWNMASGGPASPGVVHEHPESILGSHVQGL